MSKGAAEADIFDIGAAGGDVQAMGFKAFNLARLARIGAAVPEGFVIGTAWCRDYLADGEQVLERLRDHLAARLQRLERACGSSLGSGRRPLLVSVRSGAPVSMPGMMDSLLNVGLNDVAVGGLIRATGNPRLAWDSYRRLIQQYAEVVHGAAAAPLREMVTRACERAGVAHASDLDYRALSGLTRAFQAAFLERVGRGFPQDPLVQLRSAIAAVFASWRSPRAVEYRRLSGIDDTLGTAVTVQRMVFGNAGGSSGAGVGFTRDPATGENRNCVEFLFNAQGEDVVSGRHEAGDAARLPQALPQVAREIEQLKASLEREFGDAQEFEFTVQEGKLYVLQTRTAKRSPWAALRIAVDQVREGLIDRSAALRRLAALDLGAVHRLRLVADGATQLAGRGVGAGIGVAQGVVALDPETAQDLARAGKSAILVREDVSTDDIAGLAAAAGVLTARGGRTSHAAVVARDMGKACIVGCRELRIDLAARCIQVGDRRIAEGAPVCLDAGTGAIYDGWCETVIDRPAEYLAEIARWQREGAAA